MALFGGLAAAAHGVHLTLAPGSDADGVGSDEGEDRARSPRADDAVTPGAREKKEDRGGKCRSPASKHAGVPDGLPARGRFMTRSCLALAPLLAAPFDPVLCDVVVQNTGT